MSPNQCELIGLDLSCPIIGGFVKANLMNLKVYKCEYCVGFPLDWFDKNGIKKRNLWNISCHNFFCYWNNLIDWIKFD